MTWEKLQVVFQIKLHFGISPNCVLLVLAAQNTSEHIEHKHPDTLSVCITHLCSNVDNVGKHALVPLIF